MSSIHLTVPAQPAFVSLVRLVVGRAARQAGVGQERTEDVKIAAAEAVSTAIRARTGSAPPPVDVSFGAVDAGFEVVVAGLTVDDTSGDGGDRDADALDPKLSFTLIEGLTDEVDHLADGTTTGLRFVIAFD